MTLERLIQLKPREEILEVVRESFVPHSGKFFLLGLWFLVPFFFLFPLFRSGTLGMIAFGVLFLSATIFLWRAFHRWSHTLFVITDRRLIDIDQRGFFDRIVTETVYAQIDEVNYRVKGIFPTLFRYGTIFVHLGGAAADIEFEHVHAPARLHDLINDLRHEHD